MLNNEEQKIKNLLYEHSTRKMLKESTAAVEVGRPQWLRIGMTAAAALIVVFAGLQIFNINTKTNKDDKIAQVFEVPKVNKSRSALKNIIDDHAKDVNKGNYQEALKALDQNTLSDKDQIYKAYILFSEKKYTQCENLIAKYNNPNSEYHDEYNWLDFLIGVVNKESDELLKNKAGKLSEEFAVKAQRIIED